MDKALARVATKYIPLGSVSLIKIRKWVHHNEHTPIAQLWINACCTVSLIIKCEYEVDIKSQLREYFPKGKREYYEESANINSAIFFARDVIGRTILRIIKKEAAYKWPY